MHTLEAIGSGMIGACALTALHETARRVHPDAPRMDVLGRRAIARGLESAGVDPPGRDGLQAAALAGDVVANSIYYSAVGMGSREGAWLRGAVLGLAAGLGGVVLPGPLGLGKAPSARTPQTGLMTVAWYLAGGLAAAAAFRLMTSPSGRY